MHCNNYESPRLEDKKKWTNKSQTRLRRVLVRSFCPPVSVFRSHRCEPPCQYNGNRLRCELCTPAQGGKCGAGGSPINVPVSFFYAIRIIPRRKFGCTLRGEAYNSQVHKSSCPGTPNENISPKNAPPPPTSHRQVSAHYTKLLCV